MVEHSVCLRCGRKLKSPKSRELGFGETCWRKQQEKKQNKTLFSKEEMYAAQQCGNDSQTPDSTK